MSLYPVNQRIIDERYMCGKFNSCIVFIKDFTRDDKSTINLVLTNKPESFENTCITDVLDAVIFEKIF